MGRLPNPRHEHFAQLLAEGWSATAAYEEVGYKPNDGNAIRLKGNERVVARIDELQQRAQTRHDVTLDSLTRELEEVRDKALKDGKYSAAATAIMGKADLHGLRANPRQNDRPPLEDLPDDELDSAIERFAAEAGVAGIAGREKPETTH